MIQRKPLRLKDYDYRSNGAYHITICTKNRKKLLSRIMIVGEGLCALPTIVLTDIGRDVERSIDYINATYEHIRVVKYGIMPDHIHMLFVVDHAGGHGDPPLQKVIEDFKSFTTHQYGQPMWQRSYYDHVIRGQQDFDETWQYIEHNPIRWLKNR